MPYSGLDDLFKEEKDKKEQSVKEEKRKIELLDILMLCKDEYVWIQTTKSQIRGYGDSIIADFGNNKMLMSTVVDSISFGEDHMPVKTGAVKNNHLNIWIQKENK